MLFLRRGDSLLTIRGFSHGGSSLDPRLTEDLLQGKAEKRLHDVLVDPLQQNDLATRNIDTVQEMATVLKNIRVGSASPPKSFLSPQTIKALREQGALGYW